MTDQRQQLPSEWNDFVSQMNAQFMEAVEKNMEAQAEFVEHWSETIDQTADSELGDGAEGYKRAYEAWMDAADQMVDRMNDAEDDQIDPEEFRDLWLSTANSAFKEVMNTTAFAAWTGSAVGQMLELQEQSDEAAETTLRTLGFATESDVAEVGDRLVELERRQHEIDRKLDRVLEELEG